MIVGNIQAIPGRFFKHNEGLDFCVAAALYKGERIKELFASLLQKEVEASRLLELITFGRKAIYLFREEVVVEAVEAGERSAKLDQFLQGRTR